METEQRQETAPPLLATKSTPDIQPESNKAEAISTEAPSTGEPPFEHPSDEEGERFIRGVLISVGITFVLGLAGLFFTLATSR